MRKFLSSVLGAGGASKDLPYNIGDAYSTAWGSWVHYRGTNKEDGSAVSIFSLTATSAGDGRLSAARNGVKRLRALRHPNVLTFLHSTEMETIVDGQMKPIIYIVTEPVVPLAENVKELNLSGSQRDEYYSWGLTQVAKAVSFLSDCKLVHGNVCLSAVVVTPSLDWKLHAFDVLSEFDGANPAAEGPMIPNEWLVASQYKPVELTKSDWAAIRKSPPWAIDVWGLGCLIQELFSGMPLKRAEDLRNTSVIPGTLLPEYQRLLGSSPTRRLNPSKLTESAFFQNKLVETIQFLEVLNLKDGVDKDSFFRKLPTVVETLPQGIAVRKILPMIASALEFGSATSVGLNSLLKIGSFLSPEDFKVKVIPTITKLFSSQDRAIRIGLLQHMDTFAPALAANVVDEQVFPQLTSGFSDSSAFLRELTLKSMLAVAPKLSQRNLTGTLLKHLSKLQVDEEAAIRTNTTILLGNIARYLNEATRKRVLVNAFTRALRDQFSPARSAGVMALMATAEYYDVVETATRILPSVMVLTMDPDSDVRGKSFQCISMFLERVKEHWARVEAGDLGSMGTSAAQSSSSALIGWAVSSLKWGGGSTKPAAETVSQGPSSTVPPVLRTDESAGPAPSSTVALQVAEGPRISLQIAPHTPEPSGQTTSPKSVDDGWATPDDVIPDDGDDDGGWADLDTLEDPAPSAVPRAATPPPPAAASSAPRFSQMPQSSRATSTTSSNPPRKVGVGGTGTTGGALGAGGTAMRSQVADGAIRSTSGGSMPKKKDEDDDDLWAAIAAPKPVSTVKPLNAMMRNHEGSSDTLPATAPVRAGQHVQLPKQTSGEVSLESMLGNALTGPPSTKFGTAMRTQAAGRGTPSGRGRAQPMKLGATRIVR
ncbi:hypothetical protein CBR_g49707 [Chara braunii]|uniref:Protein kinase domain-containing protein n=1 Tax=Chara braunii TaxID=69332 RepID=A0A388M5V0_CHABU|nr:hypothetical protein CBR_g49707 [Chara braunii]|eukprot:GBG89859.1 hypothetical protein CBR_g49707 [Chara braunii]